MRISNGGRRRKDKTKGKLRERIMVGCYRKLSSGRESEKNYTHTQYISTHIYVYIHINIHVHIHVHTRVRARIYIYIHIYVYSVIGETHLGNLRKSDGTCRGTAHHQGVK